MNYFKLKFLLLFFALAVAIPPAWAGEESVTFSNQGYTDQQEITSYEGTNFSISFDKGTNKYAPKYFNSGTAIRVYGGNTMTVTSEKVITKIELSFATGGNSNAITTDVETYSDGTWTGSSNSVKFTVGGTTGHRRISSVKVTYTDGGDTPPAEENIYQKVTNASQLVAGKTYIIVNESANVGMGAVDDNRYGTVVTDLEFADGKVNIGGSEVMELTLGGKENAWTFMLPNSQPNSQYLAKGNNDNKFLLATSPTTNISKWTIDLSNGCSIINNDNSNEDRYIRYENNRFDISNYSNVALYVKYDGGETPQPADVTLSFPENSYTATLGQTFNAPTLSVDPAGAASEVTYSSSNTGVAMVDEETGAITLVAAGTTTITAEISGSDTYNNATASYTLTVEKAPEPSEPMTFVKVKSTDDVTSGNYLIVYEDSNVALDGSLQTLDATGNTQPVEIVNDMITTAAQIYFTYDANAKTMKSASGFFIGHTGTKNTLDQSATNGYVNNISFDSNENALIVNYADNYELKFNKSSGQERFRYFSSGNTQQPIQLYKEYNPNKVATPTFSPAAGTYTEVQNVEINCTTDGATIYYTTDGNDPTTSSAVYSTAIEVAQNMTIKAMAVKEGMTNSNVATATYTISEPAEERTYNKVTDASQLIAGKKYILVYEDTPAFMGAISTTSTTYGLSITGPELEGSSVNIGQYGNIRELTLSGDASGWSFHNGDGYLTCTSTKSLNVATEISNDAKWTVSKNDDGFVLTNKAVTSRILQYNASSPRFACYEGTQQSAVLYVEDGVEPSVLPTVAKPTFEPAPQEEAFTTVQNVTISCATAGATIYYTTDGSEPTAESAVYSEPIVVNDGTTTIKAIAIKEGMTNSEVASATYTVNLPTLDAPTFDHESNIYDDAFEVAITAAEGATIYYTTDGTAPTAESAVYKDRIPVNKNMTIKAIAVKEGYKTSAVAIAEYQIKVAKPTFSPVPGTFDAATQVSIVCGTEGAAIHYTTDGTEPTAESPVFSEAIVVNDGTTTIKAIAIKEGMTNSDIAEGVYTIKQNAGLAFDPKQYNLYLGVEFTAPTLEAPEGLTVTYESNNTDVAEVNAETGAVTIKAAGEATITARWEATDTYTAGSTSYTITVKAKEPAGLKFVIQKVEGQQDNTYQYFSIGKDPVKPTLENPNDLPVTYSVLSPEGIISIDAETGEVTLLGNSGTGSIVAETTGDETHAGGKVYLSFNVRPEVATYKLVTDASKLKADDKFIIVGTNQSGTFGMDMLSYGSNNNPVLGSQKVVIADNKIETNLPEVFTLKAVGSESANWYMQENTYSSQSLTYLTARGDNGLYFQNPGQNSEMSISIASDGEATIQFPNVDAESAKYLRMTKYANARFGRYETTDGSVPIYIYKQVIQEEPTLAFAEETPAKAYVGDELTLTVNNVPKGATLTFTSNPADAVEFDDNGKVTFLKAGEVKITATTTETDEFLPGTVTYTITVENKPVVETDLEGNNLDLVAVVGKSETGKIIVSGENLKGDITLTLNDTKGVFAIDVTSIAKEDAIGEVTVTYTPKAATSEDFDKATVTIKSTDAETVTVNLTGKATLPDPEIIADPESLTMAAKVGETATATLTVMASDLRGDITLTMSESDVFTIEPATILKADMTEDGVEVTVTYKPTQAGNDNATITIASEAAESVTVTLAGSATVPEVVAMPTFSLVAGSYTGPQQVTIYCATEGATISYSTDGGSTWTVGNTVNVDKDMTIMAKAEKDGMTVSTTASATYVIITEEAPVTVNIETGYYQIKNLGNDQYANVAGRKTLNFTDAPADKAGTVIYVDVENDGTVKSLRSQAADLQRYADRAMSYVPEVVKIVAQKLNADGSGEILGETGLNKILDKFNECFDHNLHVEQAEGGYRLYGKTPSMQPVVEFYRENKDKVEAKLPNLEAFINSALEKLKAKIGGSSVFTEFKLHDIWDKMGGTLTEPTDDASTMAFYREVLNNKNYVWDFAYQTAMIYVNNLMSHDRWSEVEALLGEYAQYIDKIKQIRPEFKYYIVQKDGKPDFISEGNKDIIDNAERTIWTLEPRTDFTVNFPEANKHNGEYVTTLYTDFAYTLPEGVTAYAVTEVSTQGVATLTALEGTIPAQTPVLLKSTAYGAQTVTLSTEAGTAPADNLLVGPDYLIKTYEIKTPQVEKIFEIIQNKLPGFYEEYVAQYEYLMLKTAGTVGNKYFWGLNKDEIIFDNNCVVRSLDVQDGTVAFYDNATVSTNKAFLVDDANNPQEVIKLSLRGDINKDGVISIIDVTALIDILLDLPARNYLEPTTSYPKGLDYEAADVNENKDIEITDVTTLIDILLNMPDQPAQGSGN